MRRVGFRNQEASLPDTKNVESSPRSIFRRKCCVSFRTAKVGFSTLILRLTQSTLAILIVYVFLYSSTVERLYDFKISFEERGKTLLHFLGTGAAETKILPLRRRKRMIGVYFRGDAPNIPAACVLPQACIDSGRTLYLPKELSNHQRRLRQTCKLPHVKFYDADHPKESFDIKSYMKLNLLGIHRSRWHMPHFYQDFEGSFIALDTVFGNSEHKRIECYSGASRNGTNCGSSVIFGENPASHAILLSPRIKKTGGNSWIHQFLAHIATPQKPLFLYSDDDLFLRPNGTRRLCFKSVTVGTISFVSSAIFRNHRMFGLHSLNNEFPIQMLHGEKCILNITVITREESGEGPKGFYGARSITNIEELKKAIKKKARGKGVNPSLVVSSLSNKTFAEQIALMQRSHVLISVHGAELTNQIFVRSNSIVIEIFPFRYVPDIFANQRFRAGIRSYSTVAEGDPETFSKCLLSYNPPGSDTHDDALAVIKKFRGQALAYMSKDLNSAYHFPDSFPPMARVCYRTQKLHVDSNAIAQIAFRHSEDICQ